ncbi:MAG: helix-turn-helix domain-containing protein [Clostridia bacterium]|nr:helix-turn-helix domain-containing protein [Clostridia bacterium]
MKEKSREIAYTYLTNMQKLWYYSIMENVSEINQKIAGNIAFYRKQSGMTQAELAEKINYSDKSVSKWESGNGVPDVYTLLQLAKLFKVSLNDLVGEKAEQTAVKEQRTKGLEALIMLLSSGIIWLVATCLFVALHLVMPGQKPWWMAFMFVAPLNAILLIVFACAWKYRLLNFVSVTLLIWSGLTCFYLTGRFISIEKGWDYHGLWTVFLLGAPLQVLEVLWVFFRTTLQRRKRKGLTVNEATELAEAANAEDFERELADE